MLELLINNDWLLWIIIGVIMSVLECVTVSLISIWFVFGSIAACFVALFTDSLVVETIVFLGESVITAILLGKIIRKQKTNSQNIDYTTKLIGKVGKVTEDITAISGRVEIGDIHWSAKSPDNSVITKDTLVKVIKVENTTLVVEPTERVNDRQHVKLKKGELATA